MNLPAAIEDVSGTDVPSSVKEKAEKIQSLGGLPALNGLIAELPELLNRNKEILDEVCGSMMSYLMSEIVTSLIQLPPAFIIVYSVVKFTSASEYSMYSQTSSKE